MKKILSLALAAAMMVSAIPAAYAAEGENTYDNNYEGQMGTQITYMGTQEAAAGGAGDVWTVTVPAKMVPGDTGTVKAEGMWNSDKFLQVKAPTSVALTYGAQSMDVAITFDTMYKIGNSVEAVSAEHDIAVEDATRLFGTWEGVLVYDVQLIQKGDVNRDGVIDQTDFDLVKAEVASPTGASDMLTYGDLNGNARLDALDERIYQLVLVQNGLLSESE